MKKPILATLALLIISSVLCASNFGKSHTPAKILYELRDTSNITGTWTASITNGTFQFRFSVNSGNVQPNYPFLLKEFSSHPLQSEAFNVKREAGTMAFKGKFEDKKGSGTFAFAPDHNFNLFLKEKGITELEKQEHLIFYLTSISKNEIQQLHQLGYATTKSKLLTLAVLKIDADYIQAWKQCGDDNLSYDEIIGLKATGVTVAYAKSLNALGYKKISAKTLTELKALAISPDNIKSFIKLGFNSIPLEVIRNAKAVRLSAQDVSSMKKKGHNSSNLSDYIRLKVVGYESNNGRTGTALHLLYRNDFPQDKISKQYLINLRPNIQVQTKVRIRIETPE